MAKSTFSLKAEITSWAGLENVKFDSEGYHFIGIVGDGGEGKSSFADALMYALTGQSFKEVDPINTKTQKAKQHTFFTKDNETYEVKVSKSRKSEVFEFTPPNQKTGGKELLRKLVGNLNFDPLALKRMNEKEQIAALSEMFKIDTSKFDQNTTRLKDERKAKNAFVKNIQGYLLNHEQFSLDMDGKSQRLKHPKDATDLISDRRKAAEKNIARREQEHIRDHCISNILKSEDIIQKLEIQIRQLQIQLQEEKLTKSLVEKNLDRANEYLLSNPEVQLDSFDQQIKEVDEHNRERKEFLQYLDQHSDMVKQQEQSNRMTRIINYRVNEKRPRYITEKISGVPRMEIFEKEYDENGKCIQEQEGVYYLGRPLRVLSPSEIMKFGIAVLRATNRQALPVIILDEFQSIGTIGRHEISRLCKDEGFYAIFCEMKLGAPLQIVLSNDLNYETTKTPIKVYPVEKNSWLPDASENKGR